MPGFDGMEVEGYDPDSMYGVYLDARSKCGEKPDPKDIAREIEKALSERDGGFKGRNSVGAVYSEVYKARDLAVSKLMLKTRFTQCRSTIKEVTPMTWDDIGCDYGDELTVVTVDGRSFTGTLSDFEIDFDGSYGGDSISLDIEGSLPVRFEEGTIAEIRPLRA